MTDWPLTDAAPGPLSGVRVLDLSRVLAGPFCCGVLADLGADVLKVERPGVGDDTRGWGPPFHGADAAYFVGVNRDRRSVCVDLSVAEGLAVVSRLVAAADVVVENFLPQHLDRLGLATVRETCAAVWVSVRGAGSDGPDGQRPGYDVMAQARSGLMSVTGTDTPTKVGVAAVDVVTGLYAAVAACAGLAARGRGSAAGSRVEVPLLESAVSMLVNQAANYLVGGVVPTPAGNDHPNIAPYGLVPCADLPLVVGAGNDAQFRALCAVAGLADLASDPRFTSNALRVAHRDELATLLGSAFGERPAADWAALLDLAGVPSTVVQDLPAVMVDPQVVAAGLVQEVDHPAGRVRVLGSPLIVDGVRPRVRRAPPLLGEHTQEVLEALGLSTQEQEVVTGADRR